MNVLMGSVSVQRGTGLLISSPVGNASWGVLVQPTGIASMLSQTQCVPKEFVTVGMASIKWVLNVLEEILEIVAAPMIWTAMAMLQTASVMTRGFAHAQLDFRMLQKHHVSAFMKCTKVTVL